MNAKPVSNCFPIATTPIVYIMVIVHGLMPRNCKYSDWCPSYHLFMNIEKEENVCYYWVSQRFGKKDSRDKDQGKPNNNTARKRNHKFISNFMTQMYI